MLRSMGTDSVGEFSMYCTLRRSARALEPSEVTTAHVLDTMRHLEAAAIALGAHSLTDHVLRDARDVNARLARSGHDVAAAARLARGFHRSLLSGCQNVRMLELLEHELRGAAVRAMSFVVDVSEASRVAADHDAILAMIEANAPQRDLERSLRQHAQASTLCTMSH